MVFADMISGHNLPNLNKHRYTTGSNSSPVGKRCWEDRENSLHFLCGCVGLAKQRFTAPDQSQLKVKDIKVSASTGNN